MILARPRRFELRTLCSGGTRSNPLSYGRAVQLQTSSLAFLPVRRHCPRFASLGASPRPIFIPSPCS